MKTKLFYYYSYDFERNLINLCGTASVGKMEPKQKFFILPDRQMSFLKILDLPPAPENKLRDMVRFQILKIYPGNTEDISSDFIPFKTGTGWKIVLYILKKHYLNEVIGNVQFGGIVLPLQLLPMKKLQNLSKLIVNYPGMVEIWKLENGVPEEVERYDSMGFSVQELFIHETLNPDKMMTIFPYSETLKLDMKNGRTLNFSETIESFPKGAVSFPEYRVTTRDRITAPIVISTFIISLVLLGMISLKHQEYIGSENEVNTWIESIQLEVEQNRGAIEVISKLEDELTQIGGSPPINVYNLLLRTSKAIGSNTDVLSFGLKGNDLSLTLQSRNALSDLKGIKDEFGNVRASNIRTLDDGHESYTVWVEIGSWR